MTRDLQQIVDSLAAALGRPVDVDDAQFRSLAYSAHVEGADPVRLESILRRQAPAEVTSHLIRELRIHEITEPLRIPALPALGLVDARVCVPVRFQDVLLGYVWLIDAAPPVEDADLVLAAQAAEQAAAVLYRTRFIEHADRERERALVHDLLTGDAQHAVIAAHQLQAGGFLTASRRYTVALARPHDLDAMADDAVGVRLTAAAERVRRSVDATRAIPIVLDRGAVLVLCAEQAPAARALLEAAREGMADGPGLAVAAGLGSTIDDLSQAGRSLAEAEIAARVAARLPELGGYAEWDALGALQILGGIEPDPSMWAPIEPLLRESSGEQRKTLEVYLRHAGNTTTASSELHLHRTSLYHRLRTIEQTCGVDLRRGDDRLRLELALRLWRLAGSPAA